MCRGASTAQGPRCTPGSLLPIQQPHFSHFMPIIFCTALCKLFLQREMHGNIFAILRVPAAQSARHVSLWTRLVPLHLGMSVPSCQVTAGAQASLPPFTPFSPPFTPFSPVPSKPAPRYYMALVASPPLQPSVEPRGYNFDLSLNAGTAPCNYGYGRKDARATGGRTQKAAKLSLSRDFCFCFPKFRCFTGKREAET